MLSLYISFQATDPEVAHKIDQFIQRLKKLKDVEEEFTLVNPSIPLIQYLLSIIVNPEEPVFGVVSVSLCKQFCIFSVLPVR